MIKLEIQELREMDNLKHTVVEDIQTDKVEHKSYIT